MVDGTITSGELIEAMLSGELRVFPGRAFRDNLGNSMVYAAPREPGLVIGDLVNALHREAETAGWRRPKNWLIERMYLGVEYDTITGSTDQSAPLIQYTVVVGGEGSVSHDTHSQRIHEGDVLCMPQGTHIERGGASPLELVSLNIGVANRIRVVRSVSDAEEFRAKKICHALTAPFCSAIPQATQRYTDGEYVEYSSIPLSPRVLARIDGVPVEQLRLALNYVKIVGEIPVPEELHYPTSSIVAMIVDGSGILMEPHGVRTRTTAGDGLVIPVDQKHYFQAPGGHMTQVGLEFGKQGSDYQKHYRGAT